MTDFAADREGNVQSCWGSTGNPLQAPWPGICSDQPNPTLLAS